MTFCDPERTVPEAARLLRPGGLFAFATGTPIQFLCQDVKTDRLTDHLATLSNGNMALLVNMAKYSALPWDCILSAELVQAYKPDPRPYQMAVKLLGLQSHEVMMVAAHQEDLRAAQAQGMQAAFVPRPQEYGPHNLPDLTPDPAFEVLATDFMDLAQQLGALDGAGRRWHIAKSARWRVRLNARQKTPRPVVFCSVEGGLLLIHFSIIPLHRLSAALDKILEHAK